MATSHKFSCSADVWTFGAEFELVDWPRHEPLPEPGMAIDDGDRAQVNSNGVAVDGPGKLYHLGGEILARPSETTDGVANQMAVIKQKWPEATHNFRGGLHIHIRVPGLRDNLNQLKQLQRFIHRVIPDVLPVINHIPVPFRLDYKSEMAYKGARANYSLWRRSHQTLLSATRLERQMAATTPMQFLEAEALHPASGRVLWATQPRACVNLRQLLQTETVEFRHFPGSADASEVLNAANWCKAFMEAALGGGEVSAQHLLDVYGPHKPGRGEKKWPWPTFPPYDHWLYTGYLYTSRYHNKPADVPQLIKDWLERKQYEVER